MEWPFALGRHASVPPRDGQPAPELVDELMDTYLSWREECLSVQST